jgi:pyruvate kinase
MIWRDNRLVAETVQGTAEAAFVTHKGLHELVSRGSPVLLDDGSIQLEVLEIINEMHH